MYLLSEIPYRPDSAQLFDPLADRLWAAFLDSGRPGVSSGRYDILAADPWVTLVTRGGLTEIRSPDQASLSPEDPFALLRRYLGEPTDPPAGLPFGGGAIGWFGYDLGRRIERLPVLAEDAEHIPDMAVGIYDWALVVDHQESRSWLVGQGRDHRTRERWPELLALFRQPPAPPPPQGGAVS